MLPRSGVPLGKGILQAPRAENWCSQKRTLQTQISNETIDGLAPSVFDHFSGAF